MIKTLPSLKEERMLLHFIVPHNMPDKMLWKRMEELYEIHNRIKDNADANEVVLAASKDLEQWILKFQTDNTVPWEVA